MLVQSHGVGSGAGFQPRQLVSEACTHHHRFTWPPLIFSLGGYFPISYGAVRCLFRGIFFDKFLIPKPLCQRNHSIGLVVISLPIRAASQSSVVGCMSGSLLKFLCRTGVPVFNVTVFRDRVFMEVINVIGGHKFGALFQ